MTWLTIRASFTGSLLGRLDVSFKKDAHPVMSKSRVVHELRELVSENVWARLLWTRAPDGRDPGCHLCATSIRVGVSVIAFFCTTGSHGA
jgi:hypothetical protein